MVLYDLLKRPEINMQMLKKLDLIDDSYSEEVLEQVEINSGSNEGIIVGIEAFNKCSNLREINF